MAAILEKPTIDAVREAGKRFDEEKENRIIEDALGELFKQYLKNTNPAHVLLKVLALNDLYSTQIPLYSKRIPTVREVVDHIVELEIDSALEQGSSDLVYNIAKTKPPNKEVHFNYSFATKYCNWHRPEFYPIYDSRVDEYLWHLQNQGYIDRFVRQDLKKYRRLKEIITKFRDIYDLGEFNFKQIDKFLFLRGWETLVEKQKEKQPAITAKSQPSQPTA
jgi:hypothetical protein